MKKIKLPDGWNEVTIKQLQELNLCDNPIDKICVLSGEEYELIEKIDTDSANRIEAAISWITQLPTKDEFKEVVTVNGKEYKAKKLSTLSYGEWVDISYYLKEDIKNLHKVMATLYEGELAKDMRAEEFENHMNVEIAWSALVFFSTIEKNCLVTIRAFFQKEILWMEMKQKLKEKKEKQRNENKINGVGSYLPITYLKGISMKWKKFLA